MNEDLGEYWTPSDVTPHDGDKECNFDGCKEPADWGVELVDRHGQHGLVRACDEHVPEYWGYHPEENGYE